MKDLIGSGSVLPTGQVHGGSSGSQMPFSSGALRILWRVARGDVTAVQLISAIF
jgi:hypothetical protein